MRIAICDDEQTALDELSSLTEDYILEYHVDLFYETFHSYEALCGRLDDFDIFILDYKMSGMDGMSFARLLRQSHPEKTILFVTAYDEIVFDAFTVQTHRFLMKPVQRDKFFEALDSVVRARQMNGQLLVKKGRTTDVLDLQSIFYIQVVRKDLYIFTKDSHFMYRGTIAALQQELEPYGFFRVHRSFLVNLRNIVRFDRLSAEFPNGESVPIGTRQYASFLREYLRLR